MFAWVRPSVVCSGISKVQVSAIHRDWCLGCMDLQVWTGLRESLFCGTLVDVLRTLLSSLPLLRHKTAGARYTPDRLYVGAQRADSR